MRPILRGSRDTGDIGPKLESPGPCGSELGGGDVFAAVADLVGGRLAKLAGPLAYGLMAGDDTAGRQ